MQHVRSYAPLRLGENTQLTSGNRECWRRSFSAQRRDDSWHWSFAHTEVVLSHDWMRFSIAQMFGTRLAITAALMNRSGVVAVFGKLSAGYTALDPLAAEFGWSLKHVSSAGALRRLGNNCRVIAVLVEAPELDISWTQTLQSVQNAAPAALIVACRRFSDSMLWTELAGAGAFHDLHVPFDPLEMRRAFGFVWAAQQRAAKMAAPIPFPMSQSMAS
jgi:hypothetical protein